jgi:hypothetical protein
VAEIEKFMNIAIGDIEKIMNIETGDIEKVMGVELPASTTSYQGGRGVAIGGYDTNTGRIADIEYKAMASDGDTLDFGDVLAGDNRSDSAMVGNDTRAVGMGGRETDTAINYIEYITIGSTGNATDFGDSTVPRTSSAGTGNGTRGISAGGYSSGVNVDNIDYITVASAGDATDFGDMTRGSRPYSSGNANLTRGIWQMGYDGDYSNLDFNYITIASAGNAADFGDWSAAITGTAGIGLIESKNIWGGGYTSGAASEWATMEYVNPASLGNTTSQGDLGSASTQSAGKFTNGTRGELWGGAYAAHDEVQKVTIASTGNASHAGDVRNGARTYWDGWTGD